MCATLMASVMAANMADGMDADTAGHWLSYAELAQVRGTDKQSALKLALRKRWPRRKNNHGTMQVCVPPEWLGEWARKSSSTASGVAPDMAFPMAPAAADGMDINSIIATLDAATASLTKRAEAAEMLADSLQQERDKAHERADIAIALADRTLAQLAEANARADRAEQVVARERTRADRAELAQERLGSELAASQIAQSEAVADAAELREAVQKAESDRTAVVAITDQAVSAAEELRQANEERKARGRWARLRAAWRRE